MTARRRLDRLHERRAAGVWRRALADVEADTLARRDATILLGRAFAIATLLVPVAFVALGGLILWTTWPAIFGGLVGGLFGVAGLYLLPRPAPLPDRLLRRDDMPQTFQLVDELAQEMGAPEVTALVIAEDFNASIAQIRGETILSLGAILWSSIPPQQRIALIAHELGHLVNDDPRRGGVIGAADGILARWHGLVVPDGSGGESLESEIIQVPLAVMIELLQSILIRLTYSDSQRAKYLADALAARVAGTEAMAGVLTHSLLWPEVEARIARHFGASTPKGIAWFEDMAEHLAGLPASRRDTLYDEAEETRHTVDQSHPPTIYRLSFLAELTHPPRVTPAELEQIDAEWAPHLTCHGESWYRQAQVQ